MVALIAAPGLDIRELDFSQYAANQTTSVFAAVGAAKRGPIGVPTQCFSEIEFISTFGKPVSGAYLAHAAIPYFRFGNQLIGVRVSDGTHATGFVNLVDSGAAQCLKVSANTPGTWANGGSSGLQVVIAAGTASGTFKMTVYFEGQIVETYDNLKRTPSTDADYVVTRTAHSAYVVVTTLSGSTNIPTTGTFSLAGGLDGISSLVDANYIGTVSGTTRTGLKTLEDQRGVKFDIVAVPGVSSNAVAQAVLALCDLRFDCFGLIDPPFGVPITGSSGVVAWHNATGDYSGSSLNDSRGATYWPWIQMYDSYSQALIWVPPSGFVAGMIAYSDAVAAPWYAPAGLTRGLLAKIGAQGIEYNATSAEIEFLYGQGNAVNPIIDDQPDGIVVWGQRTLQRRASTLDRINVRRMLTYAEKVIAASVRYLNFELIDEFTFKQFENLVNPILGAIAAGRGLYDFRVKCDASTNPATLTDQKRMRAVLLMKPTSVAEIIQIDCTLLSSGASFDEFVSQTG
jgi:hypothetical protein